MHVVKQNRFGLKPGITHRDKITQEERQAKCYSEYGSTVRNSTNYPKLLLYRIVLIVYLKSSEMHFTLNVNCHDQISK